MALRAETKLRIDELLSRPMTPQNYRDLDALYDSLPILERMEAANYGVDAAKAKFDRDINL